MDLTAQSIVHTALTLRTARPEVAAIELLDWAMEGHSGTEPYFAACGEPWADWLDPPSPFATLLQAAFDPLMPPSELAQAMSADSQAANAFADYWQAVVLERFAARYALWGNEQDAAMPRHGLSRQQWTARCAATLHEAWPELAGDDAVELAEDLWRDPHARVWNPEQAASHHIQDHPADRPN